MRWAGYDDEIHNKIFVRKPVVKRSLWSLLHRWEENIKVKM
jgi:hypothetical protein